MAFRLAPNLILPPAAVTETSAFFGTRGTGKTYGCGRMVEVFHDGGAQVVVVDPVGVWYGLRLGARGRGLGLKIHVFGGLHGDVPLEPTGGELVARLVVEKRISAVLDVSMFTLAQQHRFVTSFATTLFNLKKADRSPLHIVFDEAHEFLPQFVQGSEAEMVGAVRRLSKMGRNFGIGVSLISPRPAEVNKGSVNLTERMYCGRLKGPQDRKAIEAWASTNDADESVLDRLPTLKNGELFAWTDRGPELVRFDKKRTFDASKTPETGDAKPAAELPKINLAEVREAMAATIEEAKMNDPKFLRARIVELERAAAMVPAPAAPPAEKPGKVREVPIFREADLKRIEKLADKLRTGERTYADMVAASVDRLIGVAVDRIAQSHQAIAAAVDKLISTARAITPIVPPRTSTFAGKHVAMPAAAKAVRAVPPLKTVAESHAEGAGATMPAGCRRALTALAQNPEGLTRRKLGILTGYAPSGTSMRETLARCRKEEWVLDRHDGSIEATPAGLRALGTYAPLPTGAALRAYWVGELPAAASRFLLALCTAYPHGLTKDALSAYTANDGLGTAYAAGGTSMREGLARLRGLELVVDGDLDMIFASADLF